LFVFLGAEAELPIIEETILIQTGEDVEKTPVKIISLAAPSPNAYSTPQPSPQPAADKTSTCQCQPVNEINARIDQLSR